MLIPALISIAMAASVPNGSKPNQKAKSQVEEEIYRAVAADPQFVERVSISIRIKSEEGDGVFFGQFEPKIEKGKEPEPYNYTPVIVIKEGDKISKVMIHDTPAHSWVLATVLKNRYWGVLENDPEAPGPAVLIAWSADSGRKWRMTLFNKPSATASVTDFGMDEKGRGFVVLRQGGGPSEKIQGLHIYETQNFGVAWKKSKFLQDLTDETVERESGCGFRMSPTESISEKCRLKKN